MASPTAKEIFDEKFPYRGEIVVGTGGARRAPRLHLSLLETAPLLEIAGSLSEVVWMKKGIPGAPYWTVMEKMSGSATRTPAGLLVASVLYHDALEQVGPEHELVQSLGEHLIPKLGEISVIAQHFQELTNLAQE